LMLCVKRRRKGDFCGGLGNAVSQTREEQTD
jgi:hypothetical protein